MTQITSSGVTLGLDFFNTVNLGSGGVILVEAWNQHHGPLVLDIISNGYTLAEAQLPLNITGVEQMFRHKNLTSAYWVRLTARRIAWATTLASGRFHCWRVASF